MRAERAASASRLRLAKDIIKDFFFYGGHWPLKLICVCVPGRALVSNLQGGSACNITVIHGKITCMMMV